MTVTTIYKIVPKALWAAAQKEDVFQGAGIDLQDGYIHFSTEEQVKETASKHFADQTDLLLVAINVRTLEYLRPGKLLHEPSRDGDLFPHLYGPLPLETTLWAKPLPWLDSGVHDFPEL